MTQITGVHRTSSGDWRWICADCGKEAIHSPRTSRDDARDAYKEHRKVCPGLKEGPGVGMTLTEGEGKMAATAKAKAKPKKKAARAASSNKKAAPKRKKQSKGAVAAVWAIADKMPNAERKDVIAACVKKGINVHTARTQYQRWLHA